MCSFELLRRIVYAQVVNKTYKKSVFIFRRDLRLEDNLGLLAALEESVEVLPIFIFDPNQTDPKKNEYFSAPAFHFLLNSLNELDRVLKAKGSKLYVFAGEPESILESLFTVDTVNAVFVNKDYTPFSRKRDQRLADVCDSNGVTFLSYDDCALAMLEDIRTGQGNVYTVFTPFMKKAMEQSVSLPGKNNFSNYSSCKLSTPTINISEMRADVANYNLILKGGRDEALKILKDLSFLKEYRKNRDLPAIKGTSKLSAHHKFGTISIRETYAKAVKEVGAHSQFISELYWRDFYLYIAYHFPKVFKEAFLPWANNIKWINDESQFTAWCNGKTGVPIVDAAMRELNETGWMHNRSRMIAASYLSKSLLVDWRWGEKYFACHLIDYDPSQNNGGWQWSASTGADPKPIRIFNPFTQANKYDSEGEYIKKWVPELKTVSTNLLTDGKTRDFSELASEYPSPLVDQTASYHRAREVYKEAKYGS